MTCYRSFKRALAFAVSSALISQVWAADIDNAAPPQTASDPAGWTLSLAPYFWAGSINGDVGVRGRQPIEVDVPFRDIFDNLRFGGMIVGEAHNGTWGVFGDLIYLKLEVEKSVTRTVAGVPLNLAGTLETSSLTGTLMGEYRVVAQPAVTVDLMAGARLWNVDNEVDLALSAGGPPLAALSGSETNTWVDPMIGAKARVDLSPSWYLTGWGMIGGFGAASDFAWDVLAGVGYQWNQSFSAVGGYRALGVDYSNDGFDFDVIEYGPIFGVVIRF
ncbi:hypothetical protein [Rhizobium sp. P32RR-XVIII]|uniref:hypothetical protein n=1 Tax=Rhizobium sp. P32RR-XVIII TaxID=2726738 RepID=UPI00197F7513|nr:hypothetical protein [Rhizobium sp. P32RR-XVIII]